jgi:hypothetical protein
MASQLTLILRSPHRPPSNNNLYKTSRTRATSDRQKRRPRFLISTPLHPLLPSRKRAHMAHLANWADRLSINRLLT